MDEQTQAHVIPNFWLDSVEPVRDFYLEKLGFSHMMGVVGKDGKLDFAIVIRDGLQIMLGRPQKPLEGANPSRDRTVDIYLRVKDVDAFHTEVSKKDVKPVEKLETQWWGDRTFAVKDPYGYTLWFFQTVTTEIKPPPGVKMI